MLVNGANCAQAGWAVVKHTSLDLGFDQSMACEWIIHDFFHARNFSMDKFFDF